MASILKVDELQGIVSAGDITVTSEGGAATQSLQQGLAKAWQNLNGSTFGLRDSFNTSTATDVSTGNYNFSFTNNMSNDDYTIVMSTQNFSTNTNTANNIHQGLAPTTSTVRVQHVENSAVADTSEVACTTNGDLA